MNRMTWFRILQCVVVAPYLYHVSRDQESMYFELGLKALAGTVLFLNVPPLLAEAKPVIQAIVKLQEQAAKMNQTQKANAIEAEFEETDSI